LSKKKPAATAIMALLGDCALKMSGLGKLIPPQIHASEFHVLNTSVVE
jgi:hypothetical protein